MHEEIIKSPSSKYTLTVNVSCGRWKSVGVVRDAAGQILATINRNYSSFPHLFVEGHPNGHDYLVCGENYQGQTVIELDTLKRVDYLPKMAQLGFGFCWADMHVPENDKTVLFVIGCYWAAPYETVIYDFSHPLDGLCELCRTDNVDGEFLSCIRDEKGIKYKVSCEVYKPTGQRVPWEIDPDCPDDDLEYRDIEKRVDFSDYATLVDDEKKRYEYILKGVLKVGISAPFGTKLTYRDYLTFCVLDINTNLNNILRLTADANVIRAIEDLKSTYIKELGLKLGDVT